MIPTTAEINAQLAAIRRGRTTNREAKKTTRGKMIRDKKCAGCGDMIQRRSTWCRGCSSSVRIIPKNKCQKCGVKITGYNFCIECFSSLGVGPKPNEQTEEELNQIISEQMQNLPHWFHNEYPTMIDDDCEECYTFPTLSCSVKRNGRVDTRYIQLR